MKKAMIMRQIKRMSMSMHLTSDSMLAKMLPKTVMKKAKKVVSIKVMNVMS